MGHKVKAAVHTDAKLAEGKEHFGEGIVEDEGEEVGSNTDEGGANADRAELGTIAGGVFVKGGEVAGTKERTHGRWKLVACNNASKIEEGGEAGKVWGAVGNDDGIEGVITEEVNRVRKGTGGGAFIEFTKGFLSGISLEFDGTGGDMWRWFREMG